MTSRPTEDPTIREKIMTVDFRTANTTDNHTPTRTRAALTEFSDPASLAVWGDFLDRVYTKSLAAGSLEPLRRFLADTWASIDAAREYKDYGWTGDKVSSEEFIADWQAKHPGHDLTALGGSPS